MTMTFWTCLTVLLSILPAVLALRWHPKDAGYNLNENQTADEPKDYWGEWANHTFHPSPKNWRFPFYVLTLDRFLDGDPTNNDADDSPFEHHWLTDQFRFGGDVEGLLGDLDYIQGMGIKVGTNFSAVQPPITPVFGVLTKLSNRLCT